jgi:putative peptidoglycan lipid II flippase
MTIEHNTVDSSLADPAPLPTTATEEQDRTNEGVAKATGILALGNIISRVLGLLREIVIANLFGVSAATDAFRIAILVPKNLYDLLIGGHVNGAIIPVLSEVATQKGRDELWRLVSILLSALTALLALLVLLLEIAAPLVVDIIVSDAYTADLATDLLRITTPAMLFMGMFAILSGTLYALRMFTWPAFATAIFNATIVVIALVFAPPQRIAPGLLDWRIVRPDDGIVVVALGWLAGSVAYVLLQLPGLRGARLRFTLNWRHPALKKIGLLYLPVMFSLVLDTLVIRLFSYNLASQTGEGSISYMDNATTLIQFPQGLVATAISIAILPTLARQAALIAAANKPQQRDAFNNTLGLGLRLATTLILPAAVGLFVLATPIVALIFQHGQFTAADTETTVAVLRLYLLGLPFAAIDLLLVYAFYARQDTFTPALIGLGSLTLYMVTAILLFPTLGLFSLMVADSVKHIVHATVSAYLLNRRVGGFGEQRLLLTMGKTGFAVLMMGGVAALLLALLDGAVNGDGTLRELLVVTLSGGGAALVFALFVYLIDITELRWLLGVFRRKLS